MVCTVAEALIGTSDGHGAGAVEARVNDLEASIVPRAGRLIVGRLHLVASQLAPIVICG